MTLDELSHNLTSPALTGKLGQSSEFRSENVGELIAVRITSVMFNHRNRFFIIHA